MFTGGCMLGSISHTLAFHPDKKPSERYHMRTIIPHSTGPVLIWKQQSTLHTVNDGVALLCRIGLPQKQHSWRNDSFAQLSLRRHLPPTRQQKQQRLVPASLPAFWQSEDRHLLCTPLGTRICSLVLHGCPLAKDTRPSQEGSGKTPA